MTGVSALVAQDMRRHRRKRRIAETIVQAVPDARKKPLALMRDYFSLRGPGKLTFQEYCDYRLYDRDLFPDHTERLRFLSERRHWPLCHQCSDPRWNAATEDKWLAERLLTSEGLSTTRTLAVIGGGGRSYGKTPDLTDRAAFIAFVKALDKSVFAKTSGGMGSEGAARIVPTGDGRFELSEGGPVDAASLHHLLAGSGGQYLLQEELSPHPEMTIFGPRIGTVRLINFVVDGEVHTPFTVLKIVGADNIADNYWRSGNMVADIDPESGEVRRVVRGLGPASEVFERHPDTGARLVGAVLPEWAALRRLNREAALLYAPVKYQSLDIAIAADGPCIVEINTGSSFLLPQAAASKGFLTDEVKALFGRCGAKL